MRGRAGAVGSLPSLTTVMRRKAGLACDEAAPTLATGIAGAGGHGLAGGSEGGTRGEQHERGRKRTTLALALARKTKVRLYCRCV
jgi:hypothetical protein